MPTCSGVVPALDLWHLRDFRTRLEVVEREEVVLSHLSTGKLSTARDPEQLVHFQDFFSQFLFNCKHH